MPARPKQRDGRIRARRLSIDWGEGFGSPVLTPYEALVSLGEAPAWWPREACEGAPRCGDCGGDGGDPAASGNGEPAADAGYQDRLPDYPMDYYSKAGGDWSSSYHRSKPRCSSQGPP